METRFASTPSNSGYDFDSSSGGADAGQAAPTSHVQSAWVVGMNRARAASKASVAFRESRKALTSDELEGILLKELGDVHTPVELAQIRKLLLRRGQVYRNDIDSLIADAKPSKLLDWKMFLYSLLLMMAFPIVAKAVYGFLYRGEIKHKVAIERAFRLFHVPKPGHDIDIVGRPKLRKRCMWITTGLLLGNITMVICLLLGLSRAHAWLGADGNPREVLDGGNCVETIFPFLIYGYFAFQLALGLSIVAEEEAPIRKEKLEEARAEMEKASFWGERKVETTMLMRDDPIVANDQPCEICSFRHQADEGQTVDLYFHLVYSHSWYLQPLSTWRQRSTVVVMGFAALVLALLPMIVRLIRDGGYAGAARGESSPDPRDYIIVLLSQISLFVTFLLYFLQCGHTLHLCREMMNTMFFFTALLSKDDGFENGAVTRDGRIFFIPAVALHKPHNAVSWYVLRRYIKEVYRNTRKQTEIIVAIFLAALALFFIILLAIALLGLLVVKDIHLSVTALQAEFVIIWGCICIATFLSFVLFYGLKYNSLLEMHKTYLAQSQLFVVKAAYIGNKEDVAMDHLRVTDLLQENLARDDRLFTVLGVPVNGTQVKQIKAAVFSLVALGVSSTLAFLRESF